MMDHEMHLDLQVLMKSYEEENIGQSLIDIERKDEVFLAMGNMPKDIPIESTSKDDYLFMDWVDKYITKIEDQGCTRIACISEGLSDAHAWTETRYEEPLWIVASDPEEVSNHIPYGLKNKIPYSSIDWVDRNTLGMNTMGGKEFNFCYKFFVVTEIVLTCGKPQ